jgi:hypothetical protein
MITQRTIKYVVMPKDIKLSLKVNCEGVYRVFYGNHEIGNTLDREEAEYLFDLTKVGYDFYKPFGREKIE